MGQWWNRNIIEPGKGPLLLGLTAFVVTFAVTRAITRMIRAGIGPFKDNVSSSGLHVHHAVPGIIALVTGSFMTLAVRSSSPWHLVAAVLIGAGTSLVLDEFALILHLEDVYWSTEGRVSVEMISLAFAVLGLILVGASPFGVDRVGGNELVVRATAGATVVTTFAVVVACVLKGKRKMALFGIFVPVVAWVGAARLARPGSRWAKRYGPNRAAKAERRAARFDERWDPRWDRLSDFIGGKPTTPTP